MRRAHLVVLLAPPGSGKTHVVENELEELLNRVYTDRDDVRPFRLADCEATTRDDLVRNDPTFIQETWQTWTKEGRGGGQTWQAEAHALEESLRVSFSSPAFDLAGLDGAGKRAILEFFDALNARLNASGIYQRCLDRTSAHGVVDRAVRLAVQHHRHAVIDLAGRWGQTVWLKKVNDALTGASGDDRPIVTLVYPVVTSVERMQEAIISRMMRDSRASARVGLRLCLNLGVTNDRESVSHLRDVVQTSLESFARNESIRFSRAILLGNDWRDGSPKHRGLLWVVHLDGTAPSSAHQPRDPDEPQRTLLASWLDEVAVRLRPEFLSFIRTAMIIGGGHRL
jgi:hypothetical protein